MTYDFSERYAEFTKSFLEAVRLYGQYRVSDTEASHEACAHRAVKEVDLPTSMENCPIVAGLLRYVTADGSNSAAVRREALEDGYKAYLEAHV